MATSLRQLSYAAYQQRLKNKTVRVSRAKELAEARALIERVEARRRAMIRKQS